MHWGVIKHHLDKINCHIKGFIPDSEMIIFIASDYAATKNVAYFKFKTYRDYFLHSKVNFFFVRAFHQQGITLFESLSPVVVTTPQAQKHGVAYLSKKYPWVGFAGNIDDFLITDISAFAEDNSQGTKFLKR